MKKNFADIKVMQENSASMIEHVFSKKIDENSKTSCMHISDHPNRNVLMLLIVDAELAHGSLIMDEARKILNEHKFNSFEEFLNENANQMQTRKSS